MKLYKSDFANLGLKPEETDIAKVKIRYLVLELFDMRGGWIIALTPGGVDQDLQRIGYKRMIIPMFPLDENMAQPDLGTKLI